jgi:aarF domain-containing kinase
MSITQVQHMHLTDSALADTATVAFVVSFVHWLFPSFDYRWLLAEVRESLPKVHLHAVQR